MTPVPVVYASEPASPNTGGAGGAHYRPLVARMRTAGLAGGGGGTSRGVRFSHPCLSQPAVHGGGRGGRDARGGRGGRWEWG